LELEFWTEGLNSRTSTYQVWPLAPIPKIKRHGEGKERYNMAGDTPWQEVE
jgi:hypothetical protein